MLTGIPLEGSLFRYCAGHCVPGELQPESVLWWPTLLYWLCKVVYIGGRGCIHHVLSIFYLACLTSSSAILHHTKLCGDLNDVFKAVTDVRMSLIIDIDGEDFYVCVFVCVCACVLVDDMRMGKGGSPWGPREALQLVPCHHGEGMPWQQKTRRQYVISYMKLDRTDSFCLKSQCDAPLYISIVNKIWFIM